jgi:acetoin utilization deacetylase AcuC-like enzyme
MSTEFSGIERRLDELSDRLARLQPLTTKTRGDFEGDPYLRDIVEQADLHGPLVDYREKGNRIAFLGKDTVDGDDALRLQVTLKNGDILDYYLDPDTYLTPQSYEVALFAAGAAIAAAERSRDGEHCAA